MSIQFRARTITTVTQAYPPSIIGDSTIGWCCGGGLDRISSRSECNTTSGYFIAGNTDNTGCPVCTPSFTNNLNLGSCCHYLNDGGVYNLSCASVYSDIDCANIHEGGDEGLLYTFYPITSCLGSENGNVVCNNSINPVGNCCTQSDTGEIECSIKTKNKCSGYWHPNIFGVQSCIDKAPCSGVYFSDVNVGAGSARASLETLQSSTNFLETLPNTSEMYQGGLYVGIFQPGFPITPNGTPVYGNPITGNAVTYSSRGSGVGTRERSWILIAATEDYVKTSMNSKTLPGTTMSNSVYDGLYNTYSVESQKTTISPKVQKYKLNGFSDWYLPSQEELALYFKNIAYNFEISGRYAKLSEGLYMTSTVYDNGNQNFNNVYFVYSQDASQMGYGNVSLSSRNKSLNVRLFRRIYLDS
jgi:hypothetical protein